MLHAVVEEGQFAQTLGENFVVKFDVLENFLVGQEVDFGTALLGIAQHLERRNFDAIDALR